MRRLSQTVLLASILTGTSLVPLPSAILCPDVALASEAGDFGQAGRDGRDGRNGRPGQAGSNQTIFANGTDFILNLSGGDGTDGEDGGNGQNAACGTQPRNVNRNLQAPGGGDAGNGGDGGNGGNGGNLTVYYTDPTHLSRITVRASGGASGRAGQTGYSGYGCHCSPRQWQYRTCFGTPATPGYRCTNQTFSCTNGRNGQPGQRGRAGQAGQLGVLILIPQAEPLPTETPSQSLRLSDLNTRSVELSKHLWQSRTGARSLLAPGSIIADQYQEFAGRVEGQFQLLWHDQRSPSDFADETVALEIGQDQRIQITFPDSIWVEGTTDYENGLTRFNLAHIIRQTEVTQLAVADFTGAGSSLNLAIVDLGGHADVLTTTFRIRLRASDRRSGDRNPRYRTQYEGEVPAELVNRNFNRFSLALGQLPIATQYLTSGTPIEIEVVAVRSLGDRSTEQRMDWRGEIR